MELKRSKVSKSWRAAVEFEGTNAGFSIDLAKKGSICTTSLVCPCSPPKLALSTDALTHLWERSMPTSSVLLAPFLALDGHPEAI